MKWIADCQKKVYWQKICSLPFTKSKNKRLMLIWPLSLLLNSEGFICYSGRIHNAPMSQLTKLPYLLLAKHLFTTLIVYAIHVKLCYCGVNGTVAVLRQTYWLPTGRQCVKSTLCYCTICKKQNRKTYTSSHSALLSKSRIQDVHPFTVTG